MPLDKANKGTRLSKLLEEAAKRGYRANIATNKGMNGQPLIGVHFRAYGDRDYEFEMAGCILLPDSPIDHHTTTQLREDWDKADAKIAKRKETRGT